MKPVNGFECKKVAEKNGFDVRIKGDHCIITPPRGLDLDGRGYMTVPLKKELATGTGCSVRKWFLRLGIILVLGGAGIFLSFMYLIENALTVVP